jgi:UDP-glucose 4-epimerase
LQGNIKVKYLVTGGAGFIGSNIAERLLKDGHKVRILDNFSTGRRENIAPFKNDIELIEGSITDFAIDKKAVEGIDIVFHEAALPSVPRSVADPITSTEINTNGTLNLLEAARHAGVDRFVMASSSSVYGESVELPKHEKMTPGPLSPYAVSKITNEYHCRIYWQLYKLPTVCLRYFNVFGPRQDPGSEYSAVIPKFISALQNGKVPTVYGDGEQSRDFTYIENVVNANLLASQADGMAGDMFNAACGSQFTLNQLLDRLRKIIGVDTKAKYEAPRPGDIKHSFAAVEKIKACGFKPTVDFDAGLKLTVDYFSSLR